jgi:hypothetical protein
VHYRPKELALTQEELIQTYPRLWHMAEDGSWDSISKQGLLSTSALLDLYEIDGARRREIESEHRPESIKISRSGFPDAVIRDQKPMSDAALRKCLTDGITPSQWYEILNAKVFFWLSKRRLRRLLGARAYRAFPQTVLTLDTKSIVESHKDNILLSPINSGSTIMKPQPRGKGTFLSIEDYPFEKWRKKRSARNAVVELVIPGSVKDIMEHVIAAHRVIESKPTEIWRRQGTDPSDGP